VCTADLSHKTIHDIMLFQHIPTNKTTHQATVNKQLPLQTNLQQMLTNYDYLLQNTE